MRLLVGFLCLILWASHTSAGVQETISYINGLLSSGKKVAILLINMQTKIIPPFADSDMYMKVIDDQIKLIRALAGKSRVYFLDINVHEHGPTLTMIVTEARKTMNYTLFNQEGDSAFHRTDQVMEGASIRPSVKTYLYMNDIRDIVVTGCFDSACVFRTALDGLDQGLNVAVDRSLNVVVDNVATLVTHSGETRPMDREEILEVSKVKWRELKEMFPNLEMIEDAREERSGGKCQIM